MAPLVSTPKGEMLANFSPDARGNFTQNKGETGQSYVENENPLKRRRVYFEEPVGGRSPDFHHHIIFVDIKADN